LTIPSAPGKVPEALKEAILVARPELRDAHFTVAGKGFHSLAIDVDDELIFKFPDGSQAEAALEREARLLAVLQPCVTMAVPAMRLHRSPRLFSEHRKLKGDIVLRADDERLNLAAREALADDLALFFSQLHGFDRARMEAAGAVPVELWKADEAALSPAWALLSKDIVETARDALRAYHQADFHRDEDIVYGFFDAHGWNMAFDHGGSCLNGLFDFADSGFGSRSREFVSVAIVSPDLASRTIGRYEAHAGISIERHAVFLLGAAMRLSELAGALEAGEDPAFCLRLVEDWFAQTSVR
jgi:hypothetical protein